MNFCSLRWSVFGWVFLGATGLGQVVDDFDDGDDAGWTRLNPLAEFGGSATFSFPGGNSYRVQAGTSPDPGALGQGRSGALREDVDHTAFRVSVDIVAVNAALEQDIGILARVTSPGLGTLNGYSATIDTDEGIAYLSRVDGEQPSILETVEVSLDAAKDYRMVFHGYQGQFLVEFFEVADLTAPIGTMSGFDDFYPEGSTGLFGSAGIADGTVDVTFDNFSADSKSDVDQDGMSDTLEASFFGNLDQTGDGDFDGDGRSNAEELRAGSDPKVFDLIGLEVSAEMLMVRFFFAGGRSYLLEKSVDLENWEIDTNADFVDQGDGVGRLETGRNGEREFVRVKVGE